MTITTTGSLPRQRPRPARPLPSGPARHREQVSTHEMAAEVREDWTAQCHARRCTGACVVWRMRAARQAQQNRSAS